MLTLGAIFAAGCFAVVGVVIIGFIPVCLVKGVIDHIKERKNEIRDYNQRKR